jgi:predicted MFS family arabinose efflux permease
MVAAIAVVALCLDALAVRSVVLLAPFIRSGLNIDESRYGYLLSAIMAGTLLAVLPAGRLIDRLEARRGLPVILMGMGLACLAISVQTSLTGLVAALFFLGLLRAGIIPQVNRLVTGLFARSQRGGTLGLIYAAVPLGAGLGAVLFPAIGQYFSWRATYVALSMLAGAAAWLSRTQLPQDAPVAPTPGPVRDLTPLRSRVFIILAVTYGLYALSLTTELYVTLYLVDVVRITAIAAGAFFGLIQWVGVGGRVFWGILADRLFPKNRIGLLAIISWITVIAFSLLVRLGAASPSWMIVVIMALIGLSAASSWGILSTALGDVVGSRAIAVATSVIYFMTNIADVIGPILFGAGLGATQSYSGTISRFVLVAIGAACAFTGLAWHMAGSHQAEVRHQEQSG